VPSGPTIRAASYSQATADTYYRAADWQSLLAYADGWAQAEPRNANAWMIMGNAYGLGIRNDAAAAAAFRQTIAVSPSWALPYVGLGHAYLNQKCFDLAGAALEKAADRNPGSALYWKNAAAAYSYAGRLDLADEMLINEQKHLAHPDAIDWYNIGCDFNKIEDPAHAAAALHRSVALNAGYANAWNNLGVADENLGKFDEALTEYKRAAALGDSLGSSNVAHLQALVAQMQRTSHAKRGGGGGASCYDGATTVAANGATGSCPPGFGVHQGDRSDDSSPSSEPASEPEPVEAPPPSEE